MIGNWKFKTINKPLFYIFENRNNFRQRKHTLNWLKDTSRIRMLVPRSRFHGLWTKLADIAFAMSKSLNIKDCGKMPKYQRYITSSYELRHIIHILMMWQLPTILRIWMTHQCINIYFPQKMHRWWSHQAFQCQYWCLVPKRPVFSFTVNLIPWSLHIRSKIDGAPICVVRHGHIFRKIDYRNGLDYKYLIMNNILLRLRPSHWFCKQSSFSIG